MSTLEQALGLEISKSNALIIPIQQYKFHPVRRWKFDFAWPEFKIAVEINGGTWLSGRHNHPTSIAKDYEKLNTAQLLGWRIFQFVSSDVKINKQSGESNAFHFLKSINELSINDTDST